MLRSIPDDAKFKDDLAALATEETNIQNILMQVDIQRLRPDVLNALIAFSFYRFSTRASTVVALHAVDIAEATDDTQRLAEAHLVLGKILFRLDRYDEACPHFENAHRLFKTLPDGPDHWHMGECLMQLAEMWMYMMIFSNKNRLLVLEAQAELSHNPSQKYYVACGLLGLGNFLWWSSDFREALKVLSAAKSIFEELECQASTSECLILMAHVYIDSQEYMQAVDLSRLGLIKAEKSGDVRLIHDALIDLIQSLVILSYHDEALDIIGKWLPHVRAGGSPLTIGQILELLGYNCVEKMDLRKAQVAFEGARIQYSNIGSTVLGRKSKERCSANLTKLENGLTITVLSDLQKWP
ncbi:hypothetical protein BDP27DRAFT_1491936 [Rhodocollybia butyracea]|uniref:Uncharacterized protein n=1 Tax=Rhodocollybia butyracea TaxID=206335 RepID=A0A9P5TYQ7_9AGAR|nr:hypothetical protein BDP27DRAFT_1491936 [Rhodocollybia butyracea]